VGKCESGKVDATRNPQHLYTEEIKLAEEDWQINVEETGSSRIEFEVTVPPETVEEAKQAAINELQSKVEEPGFRKGSVPPGMIENKYKPQLQHNMAQRLVPHACREVYRREELRPVADPQILDFNFDEGFYLKAEVELQPELELEESDYTGLELEDRDWTVTDEDVEEKLDALKDQASQLKPIPITRPVKEGDFVKVDLQGFDDSNQPVPGSAEEDTILEIGSESNELMNDISEGVIGANVGETCRVRVKFPEDFLDDNLAGEDVWFEVNVKEIQEQDSPELADEDFLEQMGAESVEDLKSNVRERLENMAEDNRRQTLANQVYDHLLENVSLEIPEGMLQNEKEHMLNQFENQLSSQGQTLDDYLEREDMSKDEMLDQLEPEARRRIKLTLSFQAIAKKEEIEISDEEFQEYLNDWLNDMNIQMDRDEFLEQYGGEELVSNLRHQQRDEKVLDYLIEKAEVKIEEPESEESDATPDEEE